MLIKIPATKAGLPAITASIGEGISVNVTLIFSLERYREVIDAYLTGLEQAAGRGHDLSKIHSVASFFVSRVDTEVDKRLEASAPTRPRAAGQGRHRQRPAGVRAVRGGVQLGERFAAAGGQGRQRQRPLWASTGVKDPDYSDTMYVTELVVANTVNTMPEKTMQAFADHGEVRGDTVTGTKDEAQQVLDDLARVGISYDDVVTVLEERGRREVRGVVGELVANRQAGARRPPRPASTTGHGIDADAR